MLHVLRKTFSVTRSHDFVDSGTLRECSNDSYIIALNHFARGFTLAITAFGPPRPQFRMIAMQIEQRFGQSTPFVEALTSFEEPAALGARRHRRPVTGNVLSSCESLS